MSGEYRCKCCGTALQGDSELCVPCYERLIAPCGECMVRGPDGDYRVRRRGKPPQPIDCKSCRNERWLVGEYKPAR